MDSFIMAGLHVELLFCDTFKHQAPENGQVDMVHFPCPVLIQELRVIPHGVRAHSNLPDICAYGETMPHSFHLDFFFSSPNKPNLAVFERLGSLDYEEPSSIIFKPKTKVNADGLVVRGWYSTLTLAIYGTAEQTPCLDTPCLGITPQPRPGQVLTYSQPRKYDAEDSGEGAWDSEEVEYSHSPPQHQPRGPRTPPGPPPPDDDDDDDDDEALIDPVPAVIDEVPPKDEYLETISSESGHQRLNDDSFSGGRAPATVSVVVKEEVEEVDEEEEQGGDDVEDEDAVRNEMEEVVDEEDDEEEDVGDGEEETQGVESLPEEDEEADGDDGYEQISSDEESIPDEERGDYKYPGMELDSYMAEELASMPSMTYDPLDKELSLLVHFGLPYLTPFEQRLQKLTCQPARAGRIESQGRENVVRTLAKWCGRALCMEEAASLPIAINMRLLKAGLKLATGLAGCGDVASHALTEAGVAHQVLTLLFDEHMASSLKLLALRALDTLLESAEGMRDFFEIHGAFGSGYSNLLEFLLAGQTVRVATATVALLRKCHFFELAAEVGRSSKEFARHREEEERVVEDDDDIGMQGDVYVSWREPHGFKLDRLGAVLEEMLIMLEGVQHLLVQPPSKAFPTPLRVTGTAERDNPWPTLYRYLHEHHFVQSLAFFLASTLASAHPGVAHSARGLLSWLGGTQNGLLFLASQPHATSLILRTLAQQSEPTEAVEEGAAEAQALPVPVDCAFELTQTLRLAYSLQILQCVAELFEHWERLDIAAASGNSETKEDSAEVLGILHMLYLMTFQPAGRTAASHVLGLNCNITCLIRFLEYNTREGHTGEGKVRPSVAFTYACTLTLLAVQLGDNVEFLAQYADPLLKLCSRVEANAKMLELGRWLEPLKDLNFDISAIATLADYIKENLDTLTVHVCQEAPGLLTSLRVLKHIACPPHPVNAGQQKEMHWKQAVIALFSADGLALFIKLLQKLAAVLLLPWRHHANVGSWLQHATVVALATCTLTLLRTMLDELLGSPMAGEEMYELRDSRLPAALVSLHTLLCSTPLSGTLDPEEQQLQILLVDVLLTFTRVPGELPGISAEALSTSTWSLMLRELLSCTLSAPENFFSGLLLLSQLLPLPLPIHSSEPLSLHEVNATLSSRRLWGLQIQGHFGAVQELVRGQAAANCPSLRQAFYRLCIQLSDLSAACALLVTRTAFELVCRATHCTDGQEVLSPQTVSRLLAFLDSLVGCGAGKAAFLSLLASTNQAEDARLEEKPLQVLLEIMKAPAGPTPYAQQIVECVLSIIHSLCDQDLGLGMDNHDDVSVNAQLANNLIGRDHLPAVCDALLSVLVMVGPSSRAPLMSMRVLSLLADHPFGLFHVRGALKRHPKVLHSYLSRLSGGTGRDNGESGFIALQAFLDLIRQLVGENLIRTGEECENDSDGVSLNKPLPHVALEVQQLLQQDTTEREHPVVVLEKLLGEESTEDEGAESVLRGLAWLQSMLEMENISTLPVDSDNVAEPQFPLPDTLQQHFASRTVFVLTEGSDERFPAFPASTLFSSSHCDDYDPDTCMVKSTRSSDRWINVQSQSIEAWMIEATHRSRGPTPCTIAAEWETSQRCAPTYTFAVQSASLLIIRKSHFLAQPSPATHRGIMPGRSDKNLFTADCARGEDGGRLSLEPGL
uniref:protein virilizer homolog isoform X3 n=1 Tax=Myxine glutinosa TaxID=7769 RepID=UPI00358F68B1